MKKTIGISLLRALGVPAIALAVVAIAVAPEVGAQGLSEGISGANPDIGVTDDADSIVQTVINILLYIIGAVSVIMLIYGGIRYTTSGGNQTSVTAAKNTILYAIIGLIVAIFSWAIVSWIFNRLTTT